MVLMSWGEEKWLRGRWFLCSISVVVQGVCVGWRIGVWLGGMLLLLFLYSLPVVVEDASLFVSAHSTDLSLAEYEVDHVLLESPIRLYF